MDDSRVALIDEDEPESEMVTVHSERVTERRFEQGDTAVGAAVVAMVLPRTYSKRTASNGNNITGSFQVDSAYLPDFGELVTMTTWLLKAGAKSFGEVQFTGVSQKWSKADDMSVTMVSVQWAENQERHAKAFGDLIGGPVRLEIWEIQIPIFGRRADTDTPTE